MSNESSKPRATLSTERVFSALGLPKLLSYQVGIANALGKNHHKLIPIEAGAASHYLFEQA
jgi:hypothetical protein